MNRFLIEKSVEFDMGHRVPSHGGKCRNLHGHRYKVITGVSCPELFTEGAAEGMVMDFGDIKAAMTAQIHDLLDHRTMLHDLDPMLDILLPQEICPIVRNRMGTARQQNWGHVYEKETGHHDQTYIVVPFVPTAENIARFCFSIMSFYLDEYEEFNVRVEHVKIWETPNSLAVFRRGA